MGELFQTNMTSGVRNPILDSIHEKRKESTFGVCSRGGGWRDAWGRARNRTRTGGSRSLCLLHGPERARQPVALWASRNHRRDGGVDSRARWQGRGYLASTTRSRQKWWSFSKGSVNREHKRLDVLVNGIAGEDPMMAQWASFWKTDLKNVVSQPCSRALLSHVITAKYGAPLMIRKTARLDR